MWYDKLCFRPLPARIRVRWRRALSLIIWACGILRTVQPGPEAAEEKIDCATPTSCPLSQAMRFATDADSSPQQANQSNRRAAE